MADWKLLDLLNHENFGKFLGSTKTWRNQSKIRHVFLDTIKDLTGFSHHKHGNKCIVERIAHKFVAKSKSSTHIRMSYIKFKSANLKWLSEQSIQADCPEDNNPELQVIQSWVTG